MILPESEASSQSFQPGPKGPQGRLSSPEFTDYHMILDGELSQLGKSEVGTLSSIAFTFVGAALGFLPAAIDAFLKFVDQSGNKINLLEFVTIIAFAVSFNSSIICMTINFNNNRQNKNLLNEIRSRRKVPISDHSQSS